MMMHYYTLVKVLIVSSSLLINRPSYKVVSYNARGKMSRRMQGNNKNRGGIRSRSDPPRAHKSKVHWQTKIGK